ncbi:MAG: 5-carboxymethyl-2-hydroxymuconate isomerase [Clostridiaceae bacterium BRH_c20a]|nr:MAG: 5-carboxymethyl-2-hydroxymuconate isomerase [Clostridiaceae bacterium BRH_c20a]
MKLLNILQDNQYSIGIQTESGILNLKKASEKFNTQIHTNIMDLISNWDIQYKSVQTILELALNEPSDLFYDEENLVYGPCVTNPEKILCVGLNYRQHAEESNMAIPTSPLLFNKFNNSLAAYGETIKIPRVVQKMDYEVELVIVMGQEAQNVSEEEALSKVFGYCTGNDLSARDLQFKTSQWLLGKALDSFAPIGKYLVTADEVGDPNNLYLETQVNGEIRQSSNTNDMVFNCAQLVSYISQYITLRPGDIIFTGTPQGVIMGYPEDKQIWLKPGDEVITKIEKLGELKITLA